MKIRKTTITRRKEANFEVGDEVWKITYKLSNAAEGVKAKLNAPFDGPYTIVEKNSDSYYVLDVGDGNRIGDVHASQIERHNPPRQAKGNKNYKV